MKKKNNITWKYNRGPVSDKIVAGVEKTFNVKFPEDYIGCIKTNNGGRPDPRVFDFEGHGEAVFSSLLHFDLKKKGSITSIYDHIKKRLPNNVFPFASDSFGNYLCFDYRNSDSPIIVFWNHEIPGDAAIRSVCSSITELLGKLYSPRQ